MAHHHFSTGYLKTFAFSLVLWANFVFTAPHGPVDSPTDPLSTISTHQSGGDEYIVIFNHSAIVEPDVETVLRRLDLTSDDSDVRRVYNRSVFHGFSAKMKSHCLDLLANMTEVAHVEKVMTVKTQDVRDGSPWGLQRISSSSPVEGDETKLDFVYTYQDNSLGAGVDIYVVDTGVNTEHVVFNGRAITGFSYDENDQTDGDGHGTHVAGTAAGTIFGVSSNANIIAVKVLGADGSGTSTDTVAGIDWVIQNHKKRVGQTGFVGSVLSMSWGLSENSVAIDSAIREATANGIHAVVAAGNSGADSCSFSPSSSGGRNGPAITVGSIGINDEISSFSNTGSCNDVYAPGESILSAWKDSPTTINFLSGTSMACPHVTGVIAYLMVQDSSLASDPAAMKAYLQSKSLSDIVSGSTSGGDEKVLINNGIVSNGRKRELNHSLGWSVKLRRPERRLNAFSTWVRSLLPSKREQRGLEFTLSEAGPQLRL